MEHENGDRPVITAGPVITPDAVGNRTFTTVFRGYQPSEVREYLRRVAEELATAAARETELRRALQEALARAAHPQLDEAILTSGLGEHAGRLIGSARETAAAITADAEKSAAITLRDAELRIARMRQEADSLMAKRVEEADGVTASLRQSAEAESRATRDQARAEAEAVIQSARSQGKEMVAEARAVRERMLGDLARRRRAAQLQLEQLRVARERLVSAYDVVRRTLDEVTAELASAEPEARLAAEAVARRMSSDPDYTPPGGLHLGTDPGPPGPPERELDWSRPSPLPVQPPVAGDAERQHFSAPAAPAHAPVTAAPPGVEAVPAPAGDAGAGGRDADAVDSAGPAASTAAPPLPAADPSSASTSPPPSVADPSPGPSATSASLPSGASPGRSGPSAQPPASPGPSPTSAQPPSGASLGPAPTSAQPPSGPPLGPAPTSAQPPSGPSLGPAPTSASLPPGAPHGPSPAAASPASGAPGPGASVPSPQWPPPPASPSGPSPSPASGPGARALSSAGSASPASGPGAAAPSPAGPPSASGPAARPPLPPLRAPERVGAGAGSTGAATRQPERRTGGQTSAEPSPGPPSVRPQSVADRSPYRGRTLAPVDSPARPAVPPAQGSEAGDIFARLRSQVPESAAAAAEQGQAAGVADEAALSQRDGQLDSIDADLSKAVKRVLQDEQNELLDRLRQLRGRPTVSDLPAADEQAARLAGAASSLLAAAHKAGGGSGNVSAGGRLAEGLVGDLVRPLRERLERVLAADGDDPEQLAEALRAAYRQCKLQEIEPAVRHYTSAAHAVGAFSAVADGVMLRWVVDDDGPCPDCDDNSLAGPTPKGMPFPTGQLHPPAHSGCRCLLVPAGP